MKTCTPRQLADAYDALNPEEAQRQIAHMRANNIDVTDSERERPFRNWLAVYESMPVDALAIANWRGKVTKALFHALGIKPPARLGQMHAVLECSCARCGRTMLPGRMAHHKTWCK